MTLQFPLSWVWFSTWISREEIVELQVPAEVLHCDVPLQAHRVPALVLPCTLQDLQAQGLQLQPVASLQIAKSTPLGQVN